MRVTLIVGLFVLIALAVRILVSDLSGDRNFDQRIVAEGRYVDATGSALSFTFTYADYELIKPGMTYDKVVEILGGPGHEEETSNYGPIILRRVGWQNKDGAVIVVAFADDRVAVRYQTGF